MLNTECCSSSATQGGSIEAENLKYRFADVLYLLCVISVFGHTEDHGLQPVGGHP